MPDPVPNPTASVVVTPPPSPVPPQVQQPQASPDQLPQGPGPQQFQPPTQKAPPAQASPWHRAVSALLGSTTEYTQTPQGPVPVQVPNKPGNLFRSILAGAILGAGAGSANSQNDAGSGWSAAGRGAAAVQQNQQQQQKQRADEAQKQWENQRQANQDSQEEMLRKAQIAQANIETLRVNKELQGMDYTQHQQSATSGKASVQPYVDAGIEPTASDLTESQMQQYLKDHPGATSLDWEPVDVKTVINKDTQGNDVPSYEMVYSAFDPKGRVTVPQSTYDQWKKDGVFDRYPEYGTVLANGKTLDAKTYVQVKRDAEKVQADNLAKQNKNQETVLKQTQIDAAKAEIKERQAAAWNDNLSAKEKQDQEKDKSEVDTAWANLAKAGNDPSKLSAQDRVALAKAAQPAMQEVLNGIKAAANDPSAQDQLPDLWNQFHSLSQLASLGNGRASSVQPVTFINPQGQQVIATTQDQIDKATKLGYKKAGAPAPADTSPPAGQASPGFGTLIQAAQGTPPPSSSSTGAPLP